MALKFKIGPSVYEALPADVKKEYKKVGDEYQLDLDGYEDPAELRRARDREKEDAANAKREAADAKKAREIAEQKAADLGKSGKSIDDAVKAKNDEWQKKYDTDITDRDTKLGALTKATTEGHRKSIADALANKISSAPGLLSPRIADRIEVEIDPATNTPKAFILDSAGKRSALTVDDLEKEVLKNKEYAPILRGTKATGGGGAPPAPGGGGAPRQQSNPGAAPQDFTRMNPADLAAHIREQKEASGA